MAEEEQEFTLPDEDLDAAPEEDQDFQDPAVDEPALPEPEEAPLEDTGEPERERDQLPLAEDLGDTPDGPASLVEERESEFLADIDTGKTLIPLAPNEPERDQLPLAERMEGQSLAARHERAVARGETGPQSRAAPDNEPPLVEEEDFAFADAELAEPAPAPGEKGDTVSPIPDDAEARAIEDLPLPSLDESELAEINRKLDDILILLKDSSGMQD